MRKLRLLFFFLLVFGTTWNFAQVTANFSFVDSTCGNLTVSFRNKSANAGSFFWYFNPGTSGQPNPTFTFPAYGTYDVTLIAYSPTGSDTISKTVHLFPKPLAAIQGPTGPMCAGDSFPLTATYNPKHKFRWSPTDKCIHPDSSSTLVFPLLSTRFGIQVLDTQTRCSDTSGFWVNMKSCKPPLASLVFLKPPCGNYTATFINTSNNHFTSQWTWGDGAGFDMDNSDTIYHNFPGPGTYEVHLVVWDQFGAYADSLTVKIEIGDLVNALASASNSSICMGDSVILRASGGTSPIRWFPISGLTDSVGSVVIARPTSSLTYFAVVEDHGCFDTALLPIQVVQFPYTRIYTDSPCIGEPLFSRVNAGAVASGALFSWYWPGIDTLRGSSVSVVPSDTGKLQGWMKMRYSGCDTVITFTSKVFPKPEAEFDRNPTDVFIIRPEVQFYNRSRYATRYRWDFGDGNYVYDTSLSHLYSDTGTYTVRLIAFNENGCSDTASQRFTIRPELQMFVPDAFTPNQNGPSVNENFSIFINQWLPEFEFTIWDRWGEKVFETTNQKFLWDGSSKDVPCPANMYVWRMRYRVSDEKVQNEKGVLFLFR